jgi:DNA replicative helicase MCM subunit Mcm2 (Cdc46/Mcm family)
MKTKRVCAKCKKSQHISEFKSKNKNKRLTRQCRTCLSKNKLHIKNNKDRFQDRDEIRLESFALPYCPWSKGEVRQEPFGGIM